MIFSYLSFLWKRPPRSGQPQGAFSVGKQVSNPVRGRGLLFGIPGAIRTHGLPLRTRHGIVVIHDLFWNRTILRPYIHFYSRNYLHM